MIPKEFEKMIGKKYTFKGETVTVSGFKELVDKSMIKIILKDVSPAILERVKVGGSFIPFGIQASAPKASDQQIVLPELPKKMSDFAQLDVLSDILMANIDKVNKSATAIEQAKQVNELAKSVITIQRNKIDMGNLVVDIRRLEIESKKLEGKDSSR